MISYSAPVTWNAVIYYIVWKFGLTRMENGVSFFMVKLYGLYNLERRIHHE